MLDDETDQPAAACCSWPWCIRAQGAKASKATALAQQRWLAGDADWKNAEESSTFARNCDISQTHLVKAADARWISSSHCFQCALNTMHECDDFGDDVHTFPDIRRKWLSAEVSGSVHYPRVRYIVDYPPNTPRLPYHDHPGGEEYSSLPAASRTQTSRRPPPLPPPPRPPSSTGAHPAAGRGTRAGALPHRHAPRGDDSALRRAHRDPHLVGLDASHLRHRGCAARGALPTPPRSTAARGQLDRRATAWVGHQQGRARDSDRALGTTREEGAFVPETYQGDLPAARVAVGGAARGGCHGGRGVGSIGGGRLDLLCARGLAGGCRRRARRRDVARQGAAALRQLAAARAAGRQAVLAQLVGCDRPRVWPWPHARCLTRRAEQVVAEESPSLLTIAIDLLCGGGGECCARHSSSSSQ